MEYKKYALKTGNLYTIKTDKFRTVNIEINFKCDIRNCNVTCQNLLSRLMGYTSNDYKTKREMMVKREELYNLDCSRQISRMGYTLFTSFGAEILDPKYVKEEDYLENVIIFLANILQNPHIEKGKWNEKSFEIHKEKLSSAMDRYKEKPMTYAIRESRKILYKDGFLSQGLLGTHEELNKLNSRDVAEAYEKLIESPCDVTVIGNLDMDKVASLLDKYFHLKATLREEFITRTNEAMYPVKNYKEKGPFNQTQLLMLYEFKELTSFERYFVSPIFMRLFGSSSGMDDKLTKSLRVDNSLCYFCGCQAILRDNLLNIYVGLNQKNVDKAKACIENSLEEMRKGEFDTSLLNIQKEKYLQDLKLNQDSIYSLMDNYYFHEIDKSPTYEEFQKEIPKVTFEDVKNFGEKLVFLMSYVLEEEAHANN